MSLNCQKLALPIATHLLSVILICTIQFKSFAQDGTFLGTEITSVAEEGFDEVFENYTIYELNSTAVDDFVKDAEYDSQVRLNFGNTFDWDMTLFENDIRGDRYRVRVATETGIEELPKGEVITFTGYLNSDPSSEVRLTIKDNFIYGYIQQGKFTNFIEPANRFSKSAAKNHYVIYNTIDVKEDSGKKCGVTDIEDSSGLVAPDQSGAGRSLVCKRLQLAIASDYSYMVARGGHIGDAVAASLAVMNNVQGDYASGAFNDNIEFEIVEQFVSTCELCDPSTWTTTTDAGALLTNFRTWGNANGFSSGVDYDLAQLWTARDICYLGSCSTVGLAYTGVVCGFSRYHLLEDFSTNATSLRVLTSHEIGHNFNYGHDASGSGFIMAPSVNATDTWSPASITAINAFIGGIGCLDGCNAVACDAISNLDIQLTNAASPQINVSWAGTAAGNYRIRVREENTLADIFAQNTTLTNINIAPPIESCKKYEVIVEADCGGGSYSNSTVGLLINLAVTSPNGGEVWTAGNNETARWFVNSGGADCNIVDVLLSLDGGNSFPITLANDIANDGNEMISIPAGVSASTTARIKVVCANTCVTYEGISDANFTLSSTCIAQASMLCPIVTTTADYGNAALNLTTSAFLGAISTSNLTHTIDNSDPSGPRAYATTENGTSCTSGGNRNYERYDFTVDISGDYTFNTTFNEFNIVSIFLKTGFNPANPCVGSTLKGSNSFANGGGISASSQLEVDLTACTEYVLIVYASSTTESISITGPGNWTQFSDQAANTAYTYIAVIQSNNTIIAQSATADFTTLPGGGTAYNIYGVSYNNSETPNSWIGLTQSTLTDGSRCLLLSNNASTLTVTGNAPCSNPTPSLGTITNPTTLGGIEGSIQLTGLTVNTGYTLNYKKDNADVPAVPFTSDNSGNYILANLGAGIYSAINVTISTCISSNLSTTTLSNPSATATCENDLLNVDTSIDNATYTCDTVSSAEIIPGNITVIYEGCKEVILKPGFQYAPTGSATFTAKIKSGSCDSFTSPDNKINQSRINTQNTTIPTNIAMAIHPNPARDFITIDYQLKEATTVSIGLFDLTGKQISRISPQQVKHKGVYQQQVALGGFNAGMYFIVLQTEKEQISKKMILLQ